MPILLIALLFSLCGFCFCQDGEIKGKWIPSREGIIRMNFPNGADKIKENDAQIEKMMKITMEITDKKIAANGKEFDYNILDQRTDVNPNFTRWYYSCKLAMAEKSIGYIILCLHEDGELVMWNESSKIGVFKR